jgi:hypothetical protein
MNLEERAMWTKATVVSSVAAVALVAGGAGMAIAHAQGTAAPTVAAAGPTPSPAPSPSPSPGPKAGKNGAGVAREILGRLKDFEHAEWVTKGSGTTYVTHEAVLGQVKAVSATSITVTSTDGTSMTFAVNDQTKVRQRAKAGTTTPTIADVKQGQTVLVGGEKSPDLTAKNILVRAS